MAHKQRGLTVRPPQWWKHLKEYKRVFWKQQRRAFKAEIRDDGADMGRPAG